MSEADQKSLFNLYYVVDPMCSWCYAFAPAWRALVEDLPDDVNIRYVLGGLAPDSDQPMPEQMQQGIAATWRSIEQRTGTPFNHEFWQRCQPRRSTYPACRATIAAGHMRPGGLADMVARIQRGYYLEARNPSDNQTLIDFAEDIGLDRDRFAALLDSETVQKALASNLELTRRMGVHGFPAVIALYRAAGETNPRYGVVSNGYCDASTLKTRWQQVFLEMMADN